MSKDSLAIKYRPKSFKDVIGQDVVVQSLTNAIKNKNIHHSFIFGGKFGCGKCVDGDTLVQTSKGFRRIRNIVSNDCSISKIDLSVPDETGEGIAEFGYFEPQADTLKITTEDGFSLTGTPEHKIRVLDKSGCLVWKRLDKVSDRDYVAISRNHFLNNFENEKVIFQFDKEKYADKFQSYSSRQNCLKSLTSLSIGCDVTKDLMTLFGVILSEGYCCSRGLSISNTYEPMIEACSRALDYLGIAYSRFDDNRREKTQFVIHTTRKSALDFFATMGFDKKSAEKDVPDCLLGLSKASTTTWLRAYFELDGGVEKGAVLAWSISKKLLSEIQTILLGLGVVSRVRSRLKRCSNCIRKENIDSYELVIDSSGLDNFAKHIGFMSERKNRLLKQLLDKKRNANKDVIPYWQDIVIEMRRRVGVKRNGYIGSQVAPRWNSNIRFKSSTHKNITYDNARQCIQYFYKVCDMIDDDCVVNDIRIKVNELERIVSSNLYFSKVQSIKGSGQRDVYDIAKLSEDHSFYANGFVNHNTSIARIFAAMLNSPKGPSLTPDLSSSLVQDIFRGKANDVKELDAASNRGVDDIRNLTKESRYAPIESPYKIFIIDESHSLTGTAAEAMLKLIEEPPDNVIFIFCTTDPHSLKDTIRSRSISFQFNKISWSDLYTNLKKVADSEGLDYEDEALKVCARSAEGSVRNSLQNLQKVVNFCGSDPITLKFAQEILGSVSESHYYDLIDSVCSINAPKGMETIEKMLLGGTRVDQVVDGVYRHLRNLMLVSSCRTEMSSFGFSEDEIQRLHNQSSTANLSIVMEMMSLLPEVNRGLEYNLDPQILFEKFLIQSIIAKTRLNAKQKK